MVILIIVERKSQSQDSQIEIEKIKLESFKLELTKVRAESKDISCEGETCESLHSLNKSIFTSTVRIPFMLEN